jgi:hypothetical protein
MSRNDSDNENDSRLYYGAAPAYGCPPLHPVYLNVEIMDCGPNRIALLKFLQEFHIETSGIHYNVLQLSTALKSLPYIVFPNHVLVETAKKCAEKLAGFGVKGALVDEFGKVVSSF